MRQFAFIVISLACTASAFADRDFARDIRPILEMHCFDCHGDEEKPEGGVNLERFKSNDDVMGDRSVWGRVFEKIESHQMPPPKREEQPSAAERLDLLAWITDVAARPDPKVGAHDPGKPVLRRLTRLEYNNTVRDLLGLDMDIFMFPERQPFKGKDYFQPATGRMGEQVQVQLIEFGSKVPCLLPNAGLPGDNRAEHGYANRGDAMNLSPLLLEQYVSLAGSIVNHPDLPHRSRVFADLIGIDFQPPAATGSTKTAKKKGDLDTVAVGDFSPNTLTMRRADSGADSIETHFREEVSDAFREGRGGVFDSGDATQGALVVPGKGALLRVRFGDAGTKTLTVNPNEDIWLAAFSTAEATSGKKLLCNQSKGIKQFELTFQVESDDRDESISRLAVCVLGRSGQSGEVILTARFSDDTESQVTAPIAEGKAGHTFFNFSPVPGERVKSLIVDGSKFSGDYVLLDDLAFFTSGKAHPNAVPPAALVTSEKPTPPPAPIKVKANASAALKLPIERLAKFVERALRRPATAEEHARFQKLFEAEQKSGKSETDAMRVAAQAVLSSPAFLFLAERTRAEAGKVRALDDFELASRLSYLLWSSSPDDELLATARAGRLHEDATLESQTRRMLRDVRARELSESFAVQWLRLDQLYTSKPDPKLFKIFYSGALGKSTLHGPMLVESLLLFETVMVEDRSILEFVNADYTWLNPRLAKLYGISLSGDANDVIPLPTGQPNRELRLADKDPNNTWHRVSLADKNRGGFFTMAGPLTVTSLPFRTSPVKRGAWLLETIFNRPPQEPKVAFAFEDDTKDAATKMSIRERFEAHRNKAACHSCHIRLDPPGFALERFDAIGQWRDTDGGSPVDARAEWNGQPFDGPIGYKAALIKNPHEFIRGFVEHLLSYALGRKLELTDQPAVNKIQSAATQDANKFSRIVVEIVKSYPFRHIRNPFDP